MSRFGLTASVVLACEVLTGVASGCAAAPLNSTGILGVDSIPCAAARDCGVLNSISCPATGDCAAGGSFIKGVGRSRVRRAGFVVSETNGSWETPIELPGVKTLNADGYSEVDSISCAAAGDCAAGGSYADRNYNAHAFVVSETNGSWGDAIKVPGTPTSGEASVDSISCSAAGDCAAGGYYTHGIRGLAQVAFVVTETNGRWGTPVGVPGRALNTSGYAKVDSISCSAAGDCAAAGYYSDASRYLQAFVVSETNGVWGNATKVPGTRAGGRVDSISCPAAGDCAAGGYYIEGSVQAAFVVSETNGVWGNAIEVPGTATLAVGGAAAVNSISCPSIGDCAAGGSYADGHHVRAFVVDETNGTWGSAIEVPRLGTLSRFASVFSISCAAAGNCAAGGPYKQRHDVDGRSYGAAFVVSETNGSWGNAIEVPGTASLNSNGYGLNGVNCVYCYAAASTDSISCAPAGDCVAGGHWVTGSSGVARKGRPPRAFVVSETNGSWSNSIEARNFPASCVVPHRC